MPTDVLKEICQYVKDIFAVRNYHTNNYELKEFGGNRDKIHFIFIDYKKFRGGNLYTALQYSYNTRQLRILCYAQDVQNHHSHAFGCIPTKRYSTREEIIELVSVNELRTSVHKLTIQT